MKKLIHLTLAMTLFGGLVATPAIAQSGASGVVAESGASSTYTPPANSKDDFVKWAREMKERKYASRVPGKVLKKRASLVHGKTSSGSSVKTGQQVANQSVLQSRPGSVSVPTVTNTPANMSVKTRVVGAAGKVLTVAGVAMGIDLVYSGATQITGPMFGVQSNGLACDISSVLGIADQFDESCGVTANTTYIPNSDVESIPAGFYEGIDFVRGDAGNPRAVGYYTITILDDQTRTTGDALGGPMRFRIDWSGECTNNGWSAARFVASGVYGTENSPQWGLSSVVTVSNDMPQGCETGQNISREFDVVFPPTYSGRVFTGIQFQGSSFAADGYPFEVYPHPEGFNPQSNVNRIYYFPEDSPYYQEGKDGNPDRYWEIIGQCKSGETTRYVYGESDLFKETDETWPDIPEVGCDLPGEQLAGYEVWQHTLPAEKQLMYTWDLDQETKDWLDTYPECTSGSCTLELERYDTQTRRWLACFDNPELCASWFADPLKTELYRCVYNGDVLDLSDCNLYSKLFDSKQRDMLADPETGLTDNEMKPKPAPDTGDKTNPITGNPLLDQNSNCPPEFAWSELMNLWWYYQGVKCALVEVFIPKVDRSPFEPALAKFQQGKLGGLIYGFEDQITSLEAGAPRCQGPGGNLSLFTGQEIEFYPLNSCSGWQADLAPIVKGFLTFLIGMYTLASIANILMQSLGFNSRGDS